MTPRPTREATLRRAELWQDGMMMVAVEGNRKFVEADIAHYALIYSQDGPVEIKWITAARAKKRRAK
jgi:hypothetical protein